MVNYHDDDGFPNSNCYVCTNSITVKDGVVVADDFLSYLEAAYDHYNSIEHVVEPEEDAFISAVTKQYFLSGGYFFDRPDSQDKNKQWTPGDSLRKLAKDMKNHERRLSKIVNDKPEEQHYILSHYDCVPDNILNFSYLINLSRLNRPEYGIEWTIHLSEKNKWNPEAWARLLESLYGRNGC